ncbi:hypothetical protein [Spongiivirga citrea]|uniref:Fibronectin type-III domain-containing protein n=1 Tax=Spongiivirga citrea TaxID=1481457 RepID=A0A6M0CJA6_9FLAO|nr:hypothetical protein [Spongiivirga citrea]NER18005.1 hypothetical protein [Spongiivirga citrea]
MKFMKRMLAATLVLALITISCKKDDGPPPNPTAATLIFPEENSECNEGTILSATQSTVTFRWTMSNATNDYVVTLTNLDTNTTSTEQSTTNEVDITINRGTPYSWSVTSNGVVNTDPAESPTWRFYNAGPGIVSHPPFPASTPSPEMGATVPSGSITLRWQAADVDNDIASYDVVFDTVSPPVQAVGNVTTAEQIVNTSASTTYYWQITTNDSQGNKSKSQIFQFKTN